MLSQEIADMQHSIYDNLLHRHLQKAFTELRSLTGQLQEWHVDEKLNELETSYRYMIQYMLDGIKDPERAKVYNHLITETYQLTDTVCERLLTRDSMSLYYGKKRYLGNTGKTLAQTFAALDNSVNELALSELIPDSAAIANKRKEVERLAGDFFNHIWTNYPANAEEYATLREALQPHRLPEAVAALSVSALTLNITHCFDDEKIEILIDTYNNHNSDEVQIRALCGVLVALLRYHARMPLYTRLRNRITLLLDDNKFTTDTRNVLFQFIRSRDTEKITRKMNEELLPKMMKISPALYKKIKEDDALSDIESLEHNPEWQELLDNSGISDNLMELNDLQMQGADVFMSTFSHLKGFPFFNDISNWFIPFMPTHTAVTSAIGNEDWSKKFAELLKTSSFLCNSDKYSFCLSLSQVPDSQRQMMATQFRSENIELQDAQKAELLRQSRERENISNRYLQDLYRFNKLFPRRSEFYDLFAMPIEQLLKIDEFAPIMHDEKLLKVLGEYFFKNEYYNDAAYIFVNLSHNNFTDNELYQKTGYCYQSLGNYEEALEYYLKADLIKPDNLWTLRHIAICYRNMKKIEMALDYFLRAKNMAPDNLSVNLNIGHCYLEQKQYDEALKYYFKVDYLDTKGTKARRPIAWCSFLAGKTEQAQRYYQKILADSPTALDYLNAAHVTFAQGNIKDAIDLYIRSIAEDKGNIARFTKNFEQDIPDLIQAGINPDDIHIIYDQIIYQSQAQ